MTEILRRKRRKKKRSLNIMMSSNPLSGAEDDTKRLKMRKKRRRRKTRADHQIEKEWEALGRKKTYCLLSSLPETPKENHLRRRKKLPRIAKTSALNSSKIYRCLDKMQDCCSTKLNK